MKKMLLSGNSILSLVLLLLLAGAPVLTAQAPETGDEDESPTSSTPTQEAFWQADCPGGSFIVALPEISSVSKHTYTVEGGARVTEANVGTSGSIIARFYYIALPGEESPIAAAARGMNRIKELAEETQSRVTGQSQAPWQQVIKNYPTTTHAHTVEFRLQSAGTVDAIFASARESWVKQQGSLLVVEGGAAGD